MIDYLVQVVSWLHGIAIVLSLLLIVSLIIAFVTLCSCNFPVGVDRCKGEKIILIYGTPVLVVCLVLIILVPYGDTAKGLFTQLLS